MLHDLAKVDGYVLLKQGHRRAETQTKDVNKLLYNVEY